MKIYEAVAKAKEILDKNNIVDSDIIATNIMLSELDVSKAKMITMMQDERDFEKFFEKIKKVAAGIPYEYVLGEAYFYGKKYHVNENVLIPRLDSEILTNTVIEKVNELEKENNEKVGNNNVDVLEIGSGSGALAITVYENTNANILSVDISEDALEVCKRNLKLHDISEGNIRFLRSDVYKNVEGEFDIIFSNPPYIRSGDIAKLSKQVQKEPLIALDGGEDGMKYYNIIILGAKDYLKPNGYIILEIGYDQKESVKNILGKNGFSDIVCIRDIEDRDRVIIARNA